MVCHSGAISLFSLAIPPCHIPPPPAFSSFTLSHLLLLLVIPPTIHCTSSCSSGWWGVLCCHDVAVWVWVVSSSSLYHRHQHQPTCHPSPEQLLRGLEVGGMSLGLLGIVGHRWVSLGLLASSSSSLPVPPLSPLPVVVPLTNHPMSSCS